MSFEGHTRTISSAYESRASSTTVWKISHSTFSRIFFSAYPRDSRRSYNSLLSHVSTTTRSNHRSGNKSHEW